MKILRSGLFLMLLISLFSQCALAQDPAISDKYNNEEIDKMIQAFKTDYSHDVMPTAMLMQNFRRDFPGSYDVEWEKAANLYEVEFEIRGADYEAYYDEQGSLIMFKHDIYQSDLPGPIKKQIKSQYPNYRFDDIERIIKGTDVLYKVEMERGDMDIKIIIKNDGTIVNKMQDY